MNDKEKELNKIKRTVNTRLKSFESSVCVIIDTREKENTYSNFLENFKIALNRKNIKYLVDKLDTGDYSFIYDGVDYSDEFAIDRKANLDEFIGNLTEERFRNELERAKKFSYFSFAIQGGSLSDIYTANYKSLMSKNAAIGMIETIKNTIQVDFIEGVEFTEYILKKSYYWLRTKLIEKELKKA